MDRKVTSEIGMVSSILSDIIDNITSSSIVECRSLGKFNFCQGWLTSNINEVKERKNFLVL